MEENKILTAAKNSRKQLGMIYFIIILALVVIFPGANLFSIKTSDRRIMKLTNQLKTQEQLHKVNKELEELMKDSDGLNLDLDKMSVAYKSLPETIARLREIAVNSRIGVKFSAPEFTPDKEEGRQLSIKVKLSAGFYKALEYLNEVRSVSSVMKISEMEIGSKMGRKFCNLTILVASK